jgi:hypothetical protein
MTAEDRAEVLQALKRIEDKVDVLSRAQMPRVEVAGISAAVATAVSLIWRVVT